MELNEKIVQAITKLGLKSAFTWEGSARASFKNPEQNKEVVINIQGYSEVEHSGDIRGIEDQVFNLKNDSIVIEDTEFTVIDTSFDYSYDEEDRNSIEIKGKVTLKIS